MDYTDSGTMITQVLGDDEEVLVAEIYNPLTKITLTTANSETASFIEIRDSNGVSHLETYQKKMVWSERSGRGQWVYTGIAIPRGMVENLVNLGVDAAATALAGALGLTVAAVHHMIGFMGLGWSMGEMLGRALDRNGNGWIGLYSREV